MKKFDVKRAMLALGTGAVMMFGMDAKAQDVEVSVGADVVSSYIWRGQYLGAASVQPSLGLSYGGLSFGVWGSSDIVGCAPEIDLALGYEVAGAYVGLTTYYNTGGFFDWKSPETTNYLELNLSYTLPESFPMTVAVNTFLGGMGDLNSEKTQNFSTYAELSYPFAVGGVDMSVALGMVVNESEYYGVDGFALYNFTVGASKEIKITDDYSMAVFSNFTINPETEGAYLTFGVSL